jgi:hypothetical protein
VFSKATVIQVCVMLITESLTKNTGWLHFPLSDNLWYILYLYLPGTLTNNKDLENREPAAFMAGPSRSDLALLLVWSKSTSMLTRLTSHTA